MKMRITRNFGHFRNFIFPFNNFEVIASWGGARLVKNLDGKLELKGGFISPGDLDLVAITDSPEEVVELIRDYERRLGTPGVLPKAFT